MYRASLKERVPDLSRLEEITAVQRKGFLQTPYSIALFEFQGYELLHLSAGAEVRPSIGI